MKSKPKIEAVVKKIDKYEIHLRGDNTFYSAKTKEEADKIAKRIEEESQQKRDDDNNKERKYYERIELIHWNTNKYLKIISKKLWHLQRQKPKPEETIKELKQVKDDIKGFLNGTRETYYNTGYFGDSGYYSVQSIEKKDEE